MAHPLRATPRLLTSLIAAAALLCTGVGCAHAEFDIVHPPDLAQHIGTKNWAIAPVPPPVRPHPLPPGPAINIGFGATYGSAYPHYHGGHYHGYGYGYGYAPYW